MQLVGKKPRKSPQTKGTPDAERKRKASKRVSEGYLAIGRQRRRRGELGARRRKVGCVKRELGEGSV